MEMSFARSLGRKRVIFSQNVEDSNSNSLVTPLKRVCNGRFNFNSNISPLEALPQDILLHVLSDVDHDDLKQLFHVSKTIREATLIVEESHFNFTTPKKNTFDSNDEFQEIETPKAPLRKQSKEESKFNWEELNDISTVLFCVTDCTSQEEDYE